MGYHKFKLADLPYQVGATQSDGSRSSDGHPGFISFGPYISLEAGRYFAGFHVRRLNATPSLGTATIEALCDGNIEPISVRQYNVNDLLDDVAGLIGLELHLANNVERFELRMLLSENAMISVTEMKIFHF